MIGRLLVLCSVVIGLQAAPVFGQDIRQMKTQAHEDCLSGKTEAGVALLAKLYAKTGKADFIYNQGRCYEQGNRPDEAINKFREYLRVAKDAPPAERADAEKHIDECRALKAEQERERRAAAAEADTAKAQQAPAPLPPPKLIPVPPLHEPVDQAPVTIELGDQPKSESSPIYAKWWFWTGIAVVIGGAVTTYLLTTRTTTQSACALETNECATIN